jgi:hypothetical protein
MKLAGAVANMARAGMELTEFLEQRDQELQRKMEKLQ